MHDDQRFLAQLGQDVERHDGFSLAGIHVKEAATAGTHVVQILSHDFCLIVAHFALECDGRIQLITRTDFDGFRRTVRADSEISWDIHF